MRLTNSPSSMIRFFPMWEPRRLTTRGTSTTCYSDNFTFLLWNYWIYLNDINLSKGQYKSKPHKIWSISDTWFRTWNIEINKQCMISSPCNNFCTPSKENLVVIIRIRDDPVSYTIWIRVLLIETNYKINSVNMNLLSGSNDRIFVTLTHRLQYACYIREYSSKGESKGNYFLNLLYK
jgi:hypothetical protein